MRASESSSRFAIPRAPAVRDAREGVEDVRQMLGVDRLDAHAFAPHTPAREITDDEGWTLTELRRHALSRRRARRREDQCEHGSHSAYVSVRLVPPFLHHAETYRFDATIPAER